MCVVGGFESLTTDTPFSLNLGTLQRAQGSYVGAMLKAR